MRIRGAPEETGIRMKLRGDGAYEARYAFSLLKSLDASPLAMVRINSGTRSKGVDRARLAEGPYTSQEPARMTKSERRANQKDWREGAEFGLRWLADMVMSAFKRVFGESAGAPKPHAAYIEIATKIAAYNHAQDAWDGAVRAVREARPAA